MSNHQPINMQQRLGLQLSQAVNLLRNAQQQIVALAGIMQQCVVANDYSDVEAQFGLTSNGQAGNLSTGYEVQYQLNSVRDALTNSAVSPAIQQFLDQLG